MFFLDKTMDVASLSRTRAPVTVSNCPFLVFTGSAPPRNYREVDEGIHPKTRPGVGGDEGYGMISYDLWWFKISYDFPILWQWSTPKTKVIYNNYSISISPSLTLSIYIRLCPPIHPSTHPSIRLSIHPSIIIHPWLALFPVWSREVPCVYGKDPHPHPILPSPAVHARPLVKCWVPSSRHSRPRRQLFFFLVKIVFLPLKWILDIMGIPQLEWYIDSITNSYMCVCASKPSFPII